MRGLGDLQIRTLPPSTFDGVSYYMMLSYASLLLESSVAVQCSAVGGEMCRGGMDGVTSVGDSGRKTLGGGRSQCTPKAGACAGRK
jgi:hypothetical protein